MPAKSKAQQRFMGMVYQCKKTGKCASPAVKKAAKSITKKEAKKYAKTKQDNLPEKINETIPTFAQFLEQEEKQIKLTPTNITEMYKKYVGDIISRLNVGKLKEAKMIYENGPRGYVLSKSDVSLLQGKAAIDPKVSKVVDEIKRMSNTLKEDIPNTFTTQQLEKRNKLRFQRIMDRKFTGNKIQDLDLIRATHQFIMDSTAPMNDKIAVMTKWKTAYGNKEKVTVDEINKYIEKNKK